MEQESGPAGWIAAALPIDAVPAAYVEHPTVVWLNERKLTRHQRDSLSIAAKPIASHSLNDTREVCCSLTALLTNRSESELGQNCQFSTLGGSVLTLPIAAIRAWRSIRLFFAKGGPSPNLLCAGGWLIVP